MKLFEPQNLPEEYRTHKIFSTLKELAEIYDSISFTSFGFIPEGVKVSMTNMDSYIVSSIGGTLDSISILLEKARINDAISLVRKYYDEILFDIYQTIVRRDEVKNHADEFLYVQPDIQQWREGIFRTPSVQKMLHYMEISPSYSDLYKCFDFDVRYAEIRRYLDDNLHINSFLHLIKNDNHIANSYRAKYLNKVEEQIIDLFALHYLSILYLNPLYCMAMDYRDSLDVGCQPLEGSEHWPAPWVQEAFEKYVRPRKSLCDFIMASCPLDL